LYIFVVQLTTIKMTRQQFYTKHRERTENFDTDSVLMRIVSTLSDLQHVNNFRGNNKKQDINDYWNRMPFDLEIEEHLGNCVFCPKKSNLKLAAAQRDESGLYIDFLEAVSSSNVRLDNKTGKAEMMYRGKQSLQSLISMFDGSTGEQIKARIRGLKMNDSNSCSESCEVFNCQLDWVGGI